MPIAADIVKAFTPTGVLRASINLGNPILANGATVAPSSTVAQ